MSIDKLKYLELIAQGVDGKTAALEAGASSEAAAYKYHERMSKDVEVIKAYTNNVEQALARSNINLDKLVTTISEALQATKVIVMAKNTDDSFVDLVPDWGARLKATEMGLKLIGAYNQKPKDETPAPSNQKELAEALDQSDEVELSKVVFRRSETATETHQKPVELDTSNKDV
jgi:hypothetical protein